MGSSDRCPGRQIEMLPVETEKSRVNPRPPRSDVRGSHPVTTLGSARNRRLMAVICLTVLPFWGIYRGIAAAIAGGSPMAYLSVIPVLAAMIAFGYRSPPRGVGDPEADWILAAVFGGLGLFLRHLMSNRFPTLSGLWQLPLVGAVLWAACLAAVLFGVRRVIRTWPLWTFVFVTATPLPYLLFTAAAGGGVVAAAVTTGLIGAVAVAIAGTLSPLGWRLSATAATAALGAGVGLVAVSAGLDRSPHGGLLVALLTGAAIPLGAFAIMQTHASRPDPTTKSTLPERSPASLVTLGIGAVLVFVLNLPFSTREATPALAASDWTVHINLPEGQNFPFVQQYLGSGATFVRYAVPSRAGFPEGAVDVITSDNLATLRTYRDAIWYPATVPPNYQTLDIGNDAIPEGRVAATDSALATNGDALDWYIVTWLWQTGWSYQQVFVVVNQTWTSQDPPPIPAALSLRATVIGPALWLARQQADPSTVIDPIVTARAQQIVGRVMAAGHPRHG